MLGTTVSGDAGVPVFPADSGCMDRNCFMPSSSNQEEISRLPLPPTNARRMGGGVESRAGMYGPSNIINSMNIGRDVQMPIIRSDPRLDSTKDSRFTDGGQLALHKPKELSIDVEDLDIPWTDLVLKERIGAGNSGACIQWCIMHLMSLYVVC